MPLYSQLPTDIEEVDIIVAGGGTAACIIASRLSDADPSLSILVVEAGANNYDDPSIVNPLLFLLHRMPGSKAMTLHKCNKSEFLANREIVVPVGHVLGGGSSVNFLITWLERRVVAATETYHGNDPKNVHGHDGPMEISRGTFVSHRVEDAFLTVAEKLGWGEMEDLSDLESNNGVQRAKRYISPAGKRQDTGHCYLHPRLQDGKHPNLHVVVDSQVIRVLFDGQRACGVSYQPNGEGAAPRTMRARKNVVVSCGALGTPPVLERSGIGSAEVLGRVGIPVVSDVPGVGEGYEDHHSVSVAFQSNLRPDETIDGIATGTMDLTKMMQDGDKMIGWNVMDVSCKLRPSQSDLASLGADYQEVWNREFESDKTKPLIMMSLGAGYPKDPSEVPRGQYYMMAGVGLHPLSRGSLHITGSALRDPVDFDSGIFSDPERFDIRTCRRRPATRPSPRAPRPAASRPTSRSTKTPPAIEYTAEDDAVIDQWLRENVETTWHSLGTCKMLSRDRNGVVDNSLNVYGVAGLKIADLSICPTNVGGHTNNTAMTIGEKAADILIKELGLN
ncbi:GMC oxidoreductase [Apiospora sp. TS-2023a]